MVNNNNSIFQWKTQQKSLSGKEKWYKNHMRNVAKRWHWFAILLLLLFSAVYRIPHTIWQTKPAVDESTGSIVCLEIGSHDNRTRPLPSNPDECLRFVKPDDYFQLLMCWSVFPMEDGVIGASSIVVLHICPMTKFVGDLEWTGPPTDSQWSAKPAWRIFGRPSMRCIGIAFLELFVNLEFGGVGP